MSRITDVTKSGANGIQGKPPQFRQH